MVSQGSKPEYLDSGCESGVQSWNPTLQGEVALACLGATKALPPPHSPPPTPHTPRNVSNGPFDDLEFFPMCSTACPPKEDLRLGNIHGAMWQEIPELKDQSPG